MVAKSDPHPLDGLVNDPSGRPPLGDEETFTRVITQMTAAFAPRLFAIVHEYGDRVDARFAAWGMAFEDRVDVIGVGGTPHFSGDSAEELVPLFGFGSHITPRLVWVEPAG